MADEVGRYNFKIIQGSRFYRLFRWLDSGGQPVSLAGYTALMQARPNKQSHTVVFDFSDYLTLNGAAGTIELLVPGDVTAEMRWGGSVPWDLLLDNGSDKRRLISGKVSVDFDVSRTDNS